MWGGLVPLPTGEGRGSAPSQEIFPIFGLQIATFSALWGYFTVQWTVLDADSRCMTVIPCATLLYSQKYHSRLVVFHSELHLLTCNKESKRNSLTQFTNFFEGEYKTFGGIFPL